MINQQWEGTKGCARGLPIVSPNKEKERGREEKTCVWWLSIVAANKGMWHLSLQVTRSLDEYDDSRLLIHKRVSGSCVMVFGASCMEFTKRVLTLHALHLTWLLDLHFGPSSLGRHRISSWIILLLSFTICYFLISKTLRVNAINCEECTRVRTGGWKGWLRYGVCLVLTNSDIFDLSDFFDISDISDIKAPTFSLSGLLAKPSWAIESKHITRIALLRSHRGVCMTGNVS